MAKKKKKAVASNHQTLIFVLLLLTAGALFAANMFYPADFNWMYYFVAFGVLALTLLYYLTFRKAK